MSQYLHGYDTAEQRRLVEQAAYWSSTLITPGLAYRPGDRVLDIGCGVGAVLGELHKTFSGLHLAGIDREERQVDFARRHLSSLAADADLRVGDATRLPWPDHSFDHVYMMWFIEHLPLSVTPTVLAEARRVLKPAGTITIHETDYPTFLAMPSSPDWNALAQAQEAHFARHGDPHAGRRLGVLLAQAGFTDVFNRMMGFHFFQGAAADTSRLRAHADYLAGFLEPAVPELARMGFDHSALTRGVAHLRSLPDTPGASLTNVVYRGSGRAPTA